MPSHIETIIKTKDIFISYDTKALFFQGLYCKDHEICIWCTISISNGRKGMEKIVNLNFNIKHYKSTCVTQ